MKAWNRMGSAAIGALLTCGAAVAQDNVVKFGVTRYTTHSSTSGLAATPPVLPAGSDAKTGDATTVIVVLERYFTPDISAELALGLPPRVDAKGTGAAAAFGDKLLSAKNVSPTLLVNYYIGDASRAWRPYVGAGVNYTHFTGIRSSLPTSKLSMSDSFGWAVQAGLSYEAAKNWGFFASVTRLDTKTDVEAMATIPGVPVPVEIKTTVDLKPVTYQAGVWYRF